MGQKTNAFGSHLHLGREIDGRSIHRLSEQAQKTVRELVQAAHPLYEELHEIQALLLRITEAEDEAERIISELEHADEHHAKELAPVLRRHYQALGVFNQELWYIVKAFSHTDTEIHQLGKALEKRLAHTHERIDQAEAVLQRHVNDLQKVQRFGR